MPDAPEWAAIRATICFVVIDANDHVRDDANAGRYLATSENAELFSQPIDEDKAYISYQTGGVLRRVLSGGWKIGEENATAHLPDAVVGNTGDVLRLRPPARREAGSKESMALRAWRRHRRHV